MIENGYTTILSGFIIWIAKIKGIYCIHVDSSRYTGNYAVFNTASFTYMIGEEILLLHAYFRWPIKIIITYSVV